MNSTNFTQDDDTFDCVNFVDRYFFMTFVLLSMHFNTSSYSASVTMFTGRTARNRTEQVIYKFSKSRIVYYDNCTT